MIDPVLKDLLEAAAVEGIGNLEKVHPEFYSYLKSEEYLIPDDIDEVGKVKAIVDQVDNDVNQFLLTINPTMNCNFKCWYCYETHIKKSSLTSEMINKIGQFIEKTAQLPKMQFFNLAFFGGEPLLYFKRDVTPIIKKLQSECVNAKVDYGVSFTTNGYLINDDFIDFFKSNEITPHCQITLDGYKEKHDAVRYVSSQKGSYEAIVRNVKKLIMNSFPVRLRINYTSENLSDVYKIADEFDDIPNSLLKEFLMIDLHRVWQDSKNDDLIVEVKEIVDKILHKRVPVQHMNLNNVQESCYADKRNAAVINYNGDLFKCTARDFSAENRAGYLNDDGELIWENDSLEKRMSIKFKNAPCLSCKLLPICNGGCSQHALDAHDKGEEYCIFYGDEKLKTDIIISKMEEIMESYETNEA